MPDILNVPADGTAVPSQAGRVSGRAGRIALIYYVVLCLVGLYFFDRHSIWVNGDLVFGDRGDSRFHMVTLEHWWRVATGHDAFLSPNFFYPTPRVIAYSDLLGLYGLFYVPLRAFGLDTYSAFQWTIAGVCAVAFWSMLLLLRRSLGIQPALAGLFSLIFAFSGLKTMTFAETHMWSVAYIPFLMFLAIEYVRRVKQPAPARMRYAVAFAVVYGALALTSFYMAWFTALFGTFAAVLTLIVFCAVRGTGRTFGVVKEWAVANAGHLGAVLGVFAIAMAPFLLLYLPNASQVDRNLLGALPSLMFPVKLPYMGMAHLGVAFATGVAGFVWLRQNSSLKTIDANWMIAVCLAPALFLSLLFLLPVGEYFTAWAGLYLFFPGGKFIRAPIRYYTFLTLPMMMLGSIGITKLLARAKRSKGDVGEMIALTALALTALLVAEQYKSGEPLYFRKSRDLEWLARIPKPPAGCKSFAVTSGNEQQWFEKQLNAMVVAQRFDIPTLNGYSGTEPPGWRMMYPDKPGYADGVKQWALTNYLTGVCILDDQKATWSTMPGGQP